MIILPKGAFMVVQDDAPEKEEELGGVPSLIISMEDINKKPERPNTGEIAFAGVGVEIYIGKQICFRASFAEEITVEGQEFLYFRDFESSIYYVITD